MIWRAKEHHLSSCLYILFGSMWSSTCENSFWNTQWFIFPATWRVLLSGRWGHRGCRACLLFSTTWPRLNVLLGNGLERKWCCDTTVVQWRISLFMVIRRLSRRKYSQAQISFSMKDFQTYTLLIYGNVEKSNEMMYLAWKFPVHFNPLCSIHDQWYLKDIGPN